MAGHTELAAVSIVVSFFGFNQLYFEGPTRYPSKGITMETTGSNWRPHALVTTSGCSISR